MIRPVSAVILAVLVAGCSSSVTTTAADRAPTATATSLGHTLSGVIKVPGFDPTKLGTGLYSGPAGVCLANSGYQDVEAGANIVVKDGSGSIIATAQLQQAPIQGGDGITGNGTCAFPFQTVVKDTAFYQVSIGNRNPLSYSRAELTAQGWHLALSLG